MASLADLYLARGRSEADSRLRQAAIEAQRQQQNGASWGNTLASIGQAVAAIPGQMAEAKQIEQQGQLNQMRLDEAKQQQTQRKQAAIDMQTVNQIVSGFATSESGARTIPRDKLQAALAQANIPLELQGQTMKAIDAIDASLESFAKSRLEHGRQFAKDVLGSGADVDDPQALTLAVALARGNNLIDDEFVSQMNSALQSGIPAKTLLQQLAGPQEKKAPMVVGPNSGVFDPNTNSMIVPQTQPEKEPKLYPVTVDDGRGRPVEKLFTAEQMQAGVPAYRAPNSGSSEPLMAIMGPDGQAVYVPRSQAIGKRPANMREQGRPVISGDANRIADFDTSLNDLKTLSDTIAPIDPKTGKPINGATGAAAQVGAAIPAAITDLTGWGVEAKKKQAVIDRVKQVIGKTLEGGVLRKEDEYKYEKILPTIKDTAEVVRTKLAGLEKAIKQRRQTTLDALEDAGYDVGRYNARSGVTVQGKDGQSYTFPDQKSADAFKAAGG